MQIFTGETPDGFGKDHDWNRAGHAGGRHACIAFHSDRIRQLLHGWVRVRCIPFPRNGEPILTGPARNPRRFPGNTLRACQSSERTMIPPVPATGIPPGKMPRTRMNDDHSMHIPGISSHRNVNNSDIRPGTGAILHRSDAGPALTPEYRGLQSPRNHTYKPILFSSGA